MKMNRFLYILFLSLSASAIFIRMKNLSGRQVTQIEVKALKVPKIRNLTLPIQIENYLKKSSLNANFLNTVIEEKTIIFNDEFSHGKLIESTLTQAIAKPEYIWLAKSVKFMIFENTIWEQLHNGSGSYRSQFYNLFNIINRSNDNETKANLQNYMANLPLAPELVLVQENIVYKDISKNKIQVEMRIDSVVGVIVLEFDNQGLIIKATALDRPRFKDGVYVPTAWEKTYGNYKQIKGNMIPFTSQTSWLTKEKKITYLNSEIITFNRSL